MSQFDPVCMIYEQTEIDKDCDKGVKNQPAEEVCFNLLL
jgi:hypothetical protein